MDSTNSRFWFVFERRFALLFTALGCFLAAGIWQVHCAERGQSSRSAVVVGTKETPPFTIKNVDGTWSGISIELWSSIAKDLELEYEVKEFDLKGLLEAVEKGRVDVAVAALTITADREKRMDFTHPFYTTGLGIEVSRNPEGTWLTVVRRIFSGQFLSVVLALVLLLVFVGFLVWLVERRRNPEQFDRGPRGIWAGFWWAAVTMTTVGYGDKAPVTVFGRVIGLIWMFAAIIILTVFTAALTTALTVSQFKSSLQSPADLARARVGTVENSSSAEYLKAQRIPHIAYETLQEAAQALVEGRSDAVVYDRPLLRYLFATTEAMRERLDILPQILEPQEYSIAVPTGSPLREEINRLIPKIVYGQEWKDLVFRYLGN